MQVAELVVVPVVLGARELDALEATIALTTPTTALPGLASPAWWPPCRRGACAGAPGGARRRPARRRRAALEHRGSRAAWLRRAALVTQPTPARGCAPRPPIPGAARRLPWRWPGCPTRRLERDAAGASSARAAWPTRRWPTTAGRRRPPRRRAPPRPPPPARPTPPPARRRRRRAAPRAGRAAHRAPCPLAPRGRPQPVNLAHPARSLDRAPRPAQYGCGPSTACAPPRRR